MIEFEVDADSVHLLIDAKLVSETAVNGHWVKVVKVSIEDLRRVVQEIDEIVSES